MCCAVEILVQTEKQNPFLAVALVTYNAFVTCQMTVDSCPNQKFVNNDSSAFVSSVLCDEPPDVILTVC